MKLRLFFVLLSFFFSAHQAVAAASSVWSLTGEQRREFLRAYSPLIFKAAAEKKSKHYGHDWITHFDFDQDGDFSNNHRNWKDIFKKMTQEKRSYDFSPTLYTALMEFMTEKGTKSLVLIYHIYHARDGSSIHDWERVELRLDGVQAQPLRGEKVNYVAITNHGIHQARAGKDVKFWKTPSGKHAMIYQSGWRQRKLGRLLKKPRKNELRFMKSSQGDMQELLRKRGNTAELEAYKTWFGDLVFHYIFGIDSDPALKQSLGLRVLNQQSASSLYSGVKQDREIPVSQVKRIQYQLQDLADITVTQWKNPQKPEFENPSWSGRFLVLMNKSPLMTESGKTLVPASEVMQVFHNKALNDSDEDKSRSGIIRKSWFWGKYRFNKDDGPGDIARRPGEESDQEFEGRTPLPNFSERYLWQHDYLLHSWGKRPVWLPTDWYLSSAGGFDGRWIQLFKDHRTIVVPGL